MDDDDPSYLEAMLLWLYNCKYTRDPYDVPEGKSVLAHHAGVADLADKYDLLSLAESVRQLLDNFMDSLVYSGSYDDCLREITSIFEVEHASESYLRTQERIISWWCDKRAMVHGCLEDEGFLELLEACPRFSRKIAYHLFMPKKSGAE
jgi:hypothetical protein